MINGFKLIYWAPAITATALFFNVFPFASTGDKIIIRELIIVLSSDRAHAQDKIHLHTSGHAQDETVEYHIIWPICGQYVANMWPRLDLQSRFLKQKVRANEMSM